jgi:hypothetical protein
MKKLIGILLSAVMALSLAACGSAKPAPETSSEWTRQGYFQDENENMLSILPSEDPEHPGWSVGCFLGEDMYGWYIQQEGNALHGNIVPDYEEGEFIVTVTEEGEDGVQLAVEGGETYHFTPMDMPEATIFVTVNTEGRGNIEYVEGTETPEPDPESPYQSAQINLDNPTEYTLLAYPDRGWKFVKWTKDGEDFSEEALITVELSETSDFIAVFDVDEDYVSPAADLPGVYVYERANATVEIMDDYVFVTLDWANTAAEIVRWTMAGYLDFDTLTLDYEGSSKAAITFGEDGEVEKEETEYDDGTGTLTFTHDGPAFIWHDDKTGEEYTFEWVKSTEAEE